MAVTFPSSGDVLATGGGAALDLTIALNIPTSGDSILATLQLDPSGTAPTGVTAVWNSVETMTLIETWNSGAVYFYMFGLITSNMVAANLVFSWGNACWAVGSGQAFVGVAQSSVAAAFNNPAHTTVTTTTPGIAITSAVGNMAVAHMFTDSSMTVVTSDTDLWTSSLQNWGGLEGSEPYTAGAVYASGAASVTLDWAIDSAVNTFIQGCNVAAPSGQPAVKRVGGVKHASRMKGRSGAMWRKAGELLVPNKQLIWV